MTTLTRPTDVTLGSTSLPIGLRIGLAVAAPLAPLAQGLAYLVSPYGNADDPALMLTSVGADPSARMLAALLAVAQPLHFVAFAVLQNTYLDVAAAWLTALGFGAAGLSLVRRASARPGTWASVR